MKKYKSSGYSATHEDHWKSFTDIFATVCLMFFFIMVIFGVLSTYLSNEATRLTEVTLDKQKALEQQILEYAILSGAYDELDKERAALEAQRILQEAELSDLYLQFYALQNERISNMQDAKADFDAIAAYRVEMYRKIESKLKEVLGDDVSYDEEKGTLNISADFFFDKNRDDLKPEYREMLAKIKKVLFEIIDEYTDPTQDNLVRFEFFEIRGHTDMTGSGSINRGLSARRSASIINEILPNGSADETKYGKYFLASGLSKFDPKEGTVDEQTTEQMDANRRVEIIIRFDDKDIEKAISDIANTLISSSNQNTSETDDNANDGE